MNNQEKKQKIITSIKSNQYFIMARHDLKGDTDKRYYFEMGASCYDMFLVGQLLSHLHVEYKTYEDIIYALKHKTSIGGVNDLEGYCGIYNSDIQILEISGEYPDFMDQKYFEDLYPEEKDKDFLEYAYSVPLDNFLELAKKMIDFFHAHVLWIVIYEDKHGKIHLEKYDKNLDCLKDGIPFIDDRILKS